MFISDIRCNALREDRPLKEWEHTLKICILCVFLQRSRYFANCVTSPKSNMKGQKIVKGALLFKCLIIGYYAAAKGDKRMISLVSVIDSTIKAYKIVDEVTKLIFG